MLARRQAILSSNVLANMGLSMLVWQLGTPQFDGLSAYYHVKSAICWGISYFRENMAAQVCSVVSAFYPCYTSPLPLHISKSIPCFLMFFWWFVPCLPMTDPIGAKPHTEAPLGTSWNGQHGKAITALEFEGVAHRWFVPWNMLKWWSSMAMLD